MVISVAHTRPRRAIRRTWLAGPLRVALLLGVAGLLIAGVSVAAWPPSPSLTAEPAAATSATASSAISNGDDVADRTSRQLSTTRAAIRSDPSTAQSAKPSTEKSTTKPKKTSPAKVPAVFKPTAAQLKVVGRRYSRVALNVRSQPRNSSSLVTVLKAGSKISVTGTRKGSWTLVIYRGHGRWAHGVYLSKKKPEPATSSKTKSSHAKSSTSSSSSSSSSSGISFARCSSGSKMESGLTQDAIRVHRAICARYRQVRSFGGRRSGGDSYHTSGRAVDVMIGSSSLGWRIARWVRANHKRLGASEVIFSQHIWTVQRSGEGWRSMSDRGNKTANHYDHVHVSVYGNAGTG
jgi:uncharacterized protein YraI